MKLRIREDTCCIPSKTFYMDGDNIGSIHIFGKKPEKPMNWKDYKKKSKKKNERIDPLMVKRLHESDDLMTTYLTVDSKNVPDEDGFLTDYTWYVRIKCTRDEWYNWLKSRADHDAHTLGDIPDEYIDGYVFVFGDNEIYDPTSDWDFECDSYEEAREWFDDYTGFADDDWDDDYEDDKYNYGI